jgi:hypothetical protein
MADALDLKAADGKHADMVCAFDKDCRPMAASTAIRCWPWSDPSRRYLQVCAVIGAFLAVAWMTPSVSPASGTPSAADSDLFSATIADLQAGVGYHDAFGAELRRLRYPTRSIFNWRQPLLYWTLAFIPHGQSLLYVGAAVLVVITWMLQQQWATVVLLIAAMLPIATTVVTFSELWAGVLLGLSAVAYIARRRTLGVACAVAALAFRELAAPYCIALSLASLVRRDWREVRMWAVGLAVYVPYYGWHVWQATHRIGASDLSHPHSWLSLGGPVFLFRVFQFTSPIFIASTLLFAIAMACAVLVLLSQVAPRSLQLGLLPYVPFFMVIGQPFNVYWAFVVAPLFALWLSYTPAAVSTLRARQAEPASGV